MFHRLVSTLFSSCEIRNFFLVPFFLIFSFCRVWKLLILSFCFSLQCFAQYHTTNGLVSYWPANGNTNDVTSGLHGSLLNGATFGAGRVGDAFFLDGTDDYVLIGSPTPAALQLTEAVTVTLEAWVKPLSLPSTDIYGHPIATIVGCQKDSPPQGYSIHFDDRYGGPGGAGIHYQILDPTHSETNSGTPIPLNVWTHVVATRTKGSAGTIYFNGTAQPVTTYGDWTDSAVHGTNPFAIGNQIDTNRFFHGYIDEVRIYNRELTQEEVHRNYLSADTAPTCTLVRSYTSPEGANLNCPVINENGELFASVPVASSTAIGGHVEKFDKDGNFIMKIGDGQLYNPTGLAIDRHGLLWILERNSDMISVWTQDGVKQNSYPGVQTPNSIAFDSQDNFYVSNVDYNTVVKYSYDGTQLTSVGGLPGVRGIFIDREDNIFVAASDASFLRRYDTNLNLVANIPHNTLHARDFGLYDFGVLLVSDTDHNRIVAIDYDGNELWEHQGTPRIEYMDVKPSGMVWHGFWGTALRDIHLLSCPIPPCISNSDCGDTTGQQSGICANGACHCGVGFEAYTTTDPSTCRLLALHQR